MRRRLGTATALLILLIGAGACADAPSTQRVITTAQSTTSSTAGSPTATLPPGADHRWFETAQDEAATKRFLDAKAAEARSSRSKPRKAIKEASSGTNVGTPPRSNAPIPPASVDDAFWRRVANCECASGQCSNGAGYFQFTDPGTARKAGYVRGSSYEEQLSAAKRWAGMIHPREGTTAGWPHCWWVAKSGGG